MGKPVKILAIETSCDETSAAITDGTVVLSNVIWSQSNIHSKWGGVVPNLAKRAHEERIDWVVNEALRRARLGKEADCQSLIAKHITAVAVTVGPGLAVALEVGINKAKEIALKHGLPIVPVNHVEGHVLSVLSKPKTSVNLKNTTEHTQITFPALSIVASGKHTDIVRVHKIGDYSIIAHTIDDALGEALDKAARMLGFGYPGGGILEKTAKQGDPHVYTLPTPMAGRESEFKFSYSGLKTAFWQLVEKEKPLNKSKIQNLAASFQDKAFLHLERVLQACFDQHRTKDLLFGGGVSANIELRKRVRRICKLNNVSMHLPYSTNLCGDNAAMIATAGYFKHLQGKVIYVDDFSKIDRIPRAKIDQKIIFS